MGGRPYCLLLTLTAVAVNYLDCDADVMGTAGRWHLHHRDVMEAASRTACQHQLSDDIEQCLSGYERLLVSSRALDVKPGQLQRPVARTLCRQYYETLQCLYNSLLKCSADQPHLYVIANRVGHLRTFMEQTCAAVNSHTTAVDRHPPEATSNRRDDVIDEAGHVTQPMTTMPSEKLTTTPVTRPPKDGSGDRDSSDGGSSKCSTTTPGAPRSMSLHSSATPSTITSSSTYSSISLIAAVICAILRRHCPLSPTLRYASTVTLN